MNKIFNLDKFLELKEKWDWQDRGASNYAGSITPDQTLVLEDILEETNVKSVLEIGFNCGFSSLAWLLSGVEYIQSVDIAGSSNGAKFLKDTFGDRFNFFRKDSNLLEYADFNRNFDLIFIDGNHSEDGVANDINKSFLFNPKYLLFDDYLHVHHGKEIKGVANRFLDRIEFVKEYNAMPGFGLYKIK